LIALHHFVASREANWGYRASPDGMRLAWIASHGGRSTVHFRTLGADDVRPIDTHSRRTVYSFTWAADSRRILYLQDQDGDEKNHVYLASIERPDDPPVDLTPSPGSLAWIHRVIRSDPDHIVVAWNKRDRSIFDLYRVNLGTHEHTLIGENPGDVTGVADGLGRPTTGADPPRRARRAPPRGFPRRRLGRAATLRPRGIQRPDARRHARRPRALAPVEPRGATGSRSSASTSKRGRSRSCTTIRGWTSSGRS
jgi:dipeptidyl aminopeptidase/acylaminoacyl peptidase